MSTIRQMPPQSDVEEQKSLIAQEATTTPPSSPSSKDTNATKPKSVKDTSLATNTLLLVALFTFIWYYTSSKNAVATQQLVKNYKIRMEEEKKAADENFPEDDGLPHLLHFAMMVSLTAMQMIFGLAVAKALASKYSPLGLSTYLESLPSNADSTSRTGDRQTKFMAFIGLLHFLGSTFTNLGFAYGSASIVQVIKLLEPIETLLLSILVHNMVLSKMMKGSDKNSGPKMELVKFMSVIIIVSGTSLLLTSKGIKKNINVYTVLYAFLSGCSLSCRNVSQKTYNAIIALGKDKKDNEPTSHKDDDTTKPNEYSHATSTATTSTTTTDAPKPASPTTPTTKEANNDLKKAAAKGLQNFTNITYYAIPPAIACIILIEFMGIPGIKGSVVHALLTTKGANEGIMFHGFYNIASISVLGLVSAPTHSLLNVGKRISNVLVAAMFFQEPLGTYGAFGLCVAALGGFVYSKAQMIQSLLQDNWKGFSSMNRWMRILSLVSILMLIPIFHQISSSPTALSDGV